MSKGSNPRPYSVALSDFDSNFDKIFKKPSEKVAGRYRYDKELKKTIPLSEWYERNGYPEAKPKTHFIIGDITPYTSPIDGRPITSRKQHKEDLQRNGCRVYEGREVEQREADRYKAEEEKKFDKFMDEAVSDTYYKLRDGLIKPEKEIKSQWLIGED